MSTQNSYVKDVAQQEYKYGFVTSIEEESADRGLNEGVIRWISAKKKGIFKNRDIGTQWCKLL